MSRSSLAWLLTGLCFFLPRIGCAQQNLLAGDGSFETGHGVWKESGAIDDTEAFDGQRSVRLTGSLTTRERYQYKLAGGKTYTFSAYLKASEPGTKIALSAPRTNWSGDESNTVVTVGPHGSATRFPLPPSRTRLRRSGWPSPAPTGWASPTGPTGQMRASSRRER